MAGSHRCFISCLCLLVGAGTGCADLAWRAKSQPKIITDADVVQSQSVVHSASFAMRDVDREGQLVGGIYAVENNAWRWTAGDFGLVLATPPGASSNGAHLVLAFNIPDVIIRRTGPVTLSAYVNGAEVGARTYIAAGSQNFSAIVPAGLLSESPAGVDFHLNKRVARGVLEGRELGVVAVSVSLETGVLKNAP